MQLSQSVRNARVSGTIKLADMARKRAEAGARVYDLGEGEPDFDTPAHVIEAAHAAAMAGHTRYTAVAGTLPLREAIADKFQSENGLNCTADEVIVGTGAKQLVFNALLATLNDEDEAIIPAPHWVSYPDMVRIAGGVPVVVPCLGSGYKITPDALAAAITPRTRWLILNSPCNPSGAVYSAKELIGLAEVLRQHPDVAVMCDDIYEKILFTDAPFATLAQVAPDLSDRVLTVNGVSKSHAMTGWRIGYAAGPADLIAAMTKLQGQSTTNASSVSQAAALAALTGPQDLIEAWGAAYRRRRDSVLEVINAIPGFTAETPDGAFYIFVGCASVLGSVAPNGDIIETDIALSEYLLESSGAALVPGTEFGASGHLRLCFAKSDSELLEACGEIAKAVSALSKDTSGSG